MTRTLSKAAEGRMLQGVCGGIADYFGWSPFRVRLVFGLGTVISGLIPGVIAYAALSFLMPAPKAEKRFDLERFRVQ